MRSLLFFGLMATSLFCLTADAVAQRSAKKDADFVLASPAVGEEIPEVSVYLPDGSPFSTSQLRGHYTVLVFGCLT